MRVGARDGRIIVEIYCLILQIQLIGGKAEKETPMNGMDHRPAQRVQANRVGYHDASHFSREYKSLFGVPPMRDVQAAVGSDRGTQWPVSQRS